MESKCTTLQTSKSRRATSSQRTKVVSGIFTPSELRWALVTAAYGSYFEGAFGEVRKCHNRKTGAIRAVKIIRKESLDAKEKMRFF